MGEAIAKMLEMFIHSVYGTETLEFVDKIMTEMSKALVNIKGGSGQGAGSLNSLYLGFVSIGYALLVLYFIIDIYESISSSNFTTEGLVRSFTRFLFGYLVLSNGLWIMTSIMSLGSSFVGLFIKGGGGTIMGDSSTDIDAVMTVIKTYITDSKATVQMGVFLKCMIPWLLTWITKIAIIFVILERMIELSLRIVVSPIALGGAFFGGSGDVALRYIKKLAACAIQGLCVVAISWAGSQITANLASDSTTVLGGFQKSVIKAESYVAQNAQSAGGSWVNGLGNTIMSFLFNVSKVIQGKSGTEAYVDGWNVMGINMDEETGQILSEIDLVGRYVYDGTDENGNKTDGGIFNTSAMLIICAIQVAETLSIVGSQKMASDIVGM